MRLDARRARRLRSRDADAITRRAAMNDMLPIVLIEGVLVLGGALLFGWWQLRSIERDRRAAAERQRAREAAADDQPRAGTTNK